MATAKTNEGTYLINRGIEEYGKDGYDPGAITTPDVFC